MVKRGVGADRVSVVALLGNDPHLFVNKSFDTFFFFASVIGSAPPSTFPIPV
jgi:hypothetical protein